MKRRTYTAEEKARIVLEVIRGERELNEMAAAYEIAPNQIRNWKNEALEKLPRLFDAKRDSKLKEKISEQEQELGVSSQIFNRDNQNIIGKASIHPCSVPITFALRLLIIQRGRQISLARIGKYDKNFFAFVFFSFCNNSCSKESCAGRNTNK